ncbi:MAG: acetyl-CoA carboxylase biotin carboxyl carrier protein [Myxococcota bacterium]
MAQTRQKVRRATSASTRASGQDQGIQLLRDVVDLFQKSGLTELDFEDERVRIRLGKGGAVVHAAPAPVVAHAPAHAPAAAHAAAPAPAPAAETGGHVVKSPFVGTFYRAPSPEAAPFVQVGATVKKGQTLCIIEAMKLMNEIEADVDGKVAEIYVENATPVEFGQKLFRIVPA